MLAWWLEQTPACVHRDGRASLSLIPRKTLRQRYYTSRASRIQSALRFALAHPFGYHGPDSDDSEKKVAPLYFPLITLDDA